MLVSIPSIQEKIIAQTVQALAGGFAELNALTDALIAALEDGNRENGSKEACKAFEALYRKSGAMMSALTTADELHKNMRPAKGSMVFYHNSLGVLGGCLRESPEVVVGKAALTDKERVRVSVELLVQLKELASQICPHLADSFIPRKKY